MSSALDKARELGAAILDSEEYTQLKQAEFEVQEDSESFKLFRSMNSSEEDRSEALKNRKILRYIECQNRYNSLMRDINTVISYYTGHVAEKGDCSSCGGCGSK